MSRCNREADQPPAKAPRKGVAIPPAGTPVAEGPLLSGDSSDSGELGAVLEAFLSTAAPGGGEGERGWESPNDSLATRPVIEQLRVSEAAMRRMAEEEWTEARTEYEMANEGQRSYEQELEAKMKWMKKHWPLLVPGKAEAEGEESEDELRLELYGPFR